jgi:hypothetical protein
VADTKRNVSILIEAKDQASQTMKGLNGVLIGMAATAAALTAAFVAAAAAFKQAVDAAAAQQASDVKLAAALRTLGENTAETRAHLNALAGELQDLTTVDDNVIQSVAGVLASLGRLKGEGLDRAIKATLDFSAATGQDAVAAANLVAKAADGYTSALTRYGIKVDEGQNKTEAFNQALGIMETKFGGIAEASGRTFEANIRRIGNNLTDTLELIGDSVVKSEAFNGILNIMSGSFKGLQTDIGGSNDLLKETGDLISEVTILAIQAALGMVDFGIAGVQAAEEIRKKLEPVSEIFETILTKESGITSASGDIREFLESASLAFGPGAASAVASFFDLFDSTGPTKSVEEMGNLERALVAARERIQETQEQFSKLLEDLRAGRTGTIDVAEGLGNIAAGADASAAALTPLDEALKSIGGEGLAELKDSAKNVRTAFDEIEASFEIGAISEEQFDLLVEQVKAAGEAIRIAGGDIEAFLTTTGLVPEAVIQMFEAVEQQAASVSENMELAEDVSKQAAGTIGSEFVDAFFGAEDAFKGFAKTFLKQIAAMIVQALILRAITSAFSFGIGGFAGGGGGIFTAIGGSLFAQGVPGDFIPAPTPGPGPAISGRAVTGGSNTLNVGIFPAPDARQNALNVLQEINDLAERHGMRVVATELRA